MRIKNKELRRRRHRKEQVIKAADRETRKQYEGKPTSTATAGPKPKTSTPKKVAAEATPKTVKPKAPEAAAAAEKPKRAPKAEGAVPKKKSAKEEGSS